MMPLKGLDILVVEDHYFVAIELTRLLRELGARVIGPLGRLPPDECLAGKQIDAALLDVGLGTGTSLALADELALRGVPVAFVTGYAVNALPFAYRNVPRLEKPVERNTLIAAVLRLTGGTKGVAA